MFVSKVTNEITQFSSRDVFLRTLLHTKPFLVWSLQLKIHTVCTHFICIIAGTKHAIAAVYSMKVKGRFSKNE
jgi:hypothetical protein